MTCLCSLLDYREDAHFGCRVSFLLSCATKETSQVAYEYEMDFVYKMCHCCKLHTWMTKGAYGQMLKAS